MEFYEARNKLRRMGQADLLELASKQGGIPRCVIGGEACGFYFRYERLGFYVSEIMGQGCQVQRWKTLEDCHKDLKETDRPPILVDNPDNIETNLKTHSYPIPLILIPPATAKKVFL